jgi:hypothetical protein
MPGFFCSFQFDRFGNNYYIEYVEPFPKTEVFGNFLYTKNWKVKMRRAEDSYEIAVELKGLVKSLHSLADEISRLESQITSLPVSSLQSPNSVIKNFLPVSAQSTSPAATGYKTEGRRSNIIPFPASRFSAGCGSENSKAEPHIVPLPYLAAPGSDLPAWIPDFRTALQRNGLILLGWDKRFTETGERYTAYWVTSVEIPRFYASKPLLLADFPSAKPDHKSYAAEDGVEFYGQKAPAYIVHVAPDLMISNPKHRELRTAHINMLKDMGVKVNFNYKYLLKTEKTGNRRNLTRTKPVSAKN